MTRRLGGHSGSASHSFLAMSRPSPTGKQHGDQVVGLGDLLAELADGHRVLVALRGVGHPVVPQRVVEGHDPARAEQTQRLLEVGGVFGLVAVAEHDVVVTVGEPGEYVEGGAGDGPDPLLGEPRLGEGLARQALVLGLDVDGGEHSVGPHPAQQPDSRDAGAGADLDHGAGVENRGQEAQRRSTPGADADDADLFGAGAGGREDLVLGDELFGVGPAGGADRLGRSGDDSPLNDEPGWAEHQRIALRARKPGTPPLAGSLSWLNGGNLTGFSQPDYLR